MTRPDDAIYAIARTQPADVHAFLVERGYMPTESKKALSILYRDKNSDDAFFVPQDDTKHDYLPSLVRVLEQFATAENDLLDIAQRLLIGPLSTIRWRQHGQDAESGSIPLEASENIVSSTKASILYTAAGLITALPKYTNAPTPAKELAASCRLGHTQAGSFIVRIYCPLRRLSTMTQDNLPRDNFAHEVIDTYCDIVEYFSQASCGTSDISPPPAINANVAEAFAKLRPPSDFMQQELAVSYITHESNLNSVNYRHIDIAPTAFQFAKEEADRLRSGDDLEEISAYGYVSRLQKDTPFSDNEIRREVQIQIQYGTSKRFVWLSVGQRQHDIAVRFYEENTKVILRATVDKRNQNRWTAIAVQELRDANEHQLRLF